MHSPNFYKSSWVNYLIKDAESPTVTFNESGALDNDYNLVPNHLTDYTTFISNNLMNMKLHSSRDNFNHTLQQTSDRSHNN